MKRYLRIALSALVGAVVARGIMGSSTLAMPFAVIAALGPEISAKRKRDRRHRELISCWPELLDHVISGMRSGLSIAETLVGLAHRGPEIARPIFMECKESLAQGGDLEGALAHVKDAFRDPMADQVCEVLRFARGTGSRDTALALRTLADFLRSESAIRGEIDAKLGWVKNSAVVAAIAPWILLVILSSQPTTLKAYESSAGHLVLAIGLVMSALAYLWMARVGRVAITPRIFIGRDVKQSVSS